MKNLLVSIPSRDGPERLEASVKMLHDTCNNGDNFNVQIIIDIDQKVLYEDCIKGIKKTHPQTIISYTLHQEDNWLNIVKAQHGIMKSGEYYFIMIMSDDLKGLTKDWDKEIVSKKEFYESDLFCLYSQSELWGRNPEVSKNCYVDKDIITCCEHMPIWTHEFGKYFYFLFEEPYNIRYGRELILAEIIKQLAVLGHKRNVSTNYNWETVVCNKLNSRKFFPEYMEMQKNDFSLIKGIAHLMKERIEKEVDEKLWKGIKNEEK